MSFEVIKLNSNKTIPKRAPCIPVSSKPLVIGVYIHTYKDNLNFFFWVIIYIWLSLIQYLHLKLFIAWSLPSIATTTVRCLSAISVGVFFCTGIKTGFYFFFKEPQLHYQDMSECLPFNRIYKHVSEFQTTDQFTNHSTYWIETNVLYSQ